MSSDLRQAWSGLAIAKKTEPLRISILRNVLKLDRPSRRGARFALHSVAALVALCAVNGVSMAHTVGAIHFQPSAVPVENIRKLVALVQDAAARGAGIVVLPEHAIGGPLPAGANQTPLWEMSSTQAVRRFGFLAKELRIYIVLTVPECVGAQMFTTTRMFSPGAYTVLRQNKLRPHVSLGDGAAGQGDPSDLRTVGIGTERAGVSAGEDLDMAVPRLAELGADTIFVSASWVAQDAAAKLQNARRLAAAHHVNLVISNLGTGAAIVSREGEIVAASQGGEPFTIAITPASGRPMPVGLPADPAPRRQAASGALAGLGQRLFQETALSSDGRTSCSSCHNPTKAFTDGRARAAGVFGRQSEWNTRSLLNSSFYMAWGWQGKTAALEQKVLHPFGDRSQMEMSTEHAVQTLARRMEYEEPLRAAFGDRAAGVEEVAAALTAYVRTLYSGNSPFDRFRFSADVGALGPGARRGLFLFGGKAGCSGCHQAAQYDALFTDNKVHNTGTAYRPGQPEQSRSFLTPGLRNVGQTAPYMHDGSLRTLEEVVAYYDRGGNPDPDRDARVRPLRLSAAERADLVEFLKSLTADPLREQTAATNRNRGWR